jgi:hypothetical protein
MRSFVRSLAVAAALALLVPGASAASEMQVTLHEPGLAFGPAGAQLFEGTFDKIFIDGIYQEKFVGDVSLGGFSGEVGFEAGPMSLLTISYDPDFDRVTSHYEFGPGTFTLTAHWDDQFFNPVEGKYVAPLLALVVDMRCEQKLTADPCGAGSAGWSLGDVFASFGPGLFDDALAQALGIARSGGAFSFNMDIDFVTGSPADTFRVGGSQRGSEYIAIPVAVPEPSIIALLLLSPLVARRFRH